MFFVRLSVQNVQVTLSNSINLVLACPQGPNDKDFLEVSLICNFKVLINLGVFIPSVSVFTIHTENKINTFGSP